MSHLTGPSRNRYTFTSVTSQATDAEKTTGKIEGRVVAVYRSPKELFQKEIIKHPFMSPNAYKRYIAKRAALPANKSAFSPIINGKTLSNTQKAEDKAVHTLEHAPGDAQKSQICLSNGLR